MPDQKTPTPQEAMGIGAYGGGWDVGTALNISGAVQRHIALDKDTNILRIQTESPVHILFDTALATSNTVANDPVLPAGWHDIPVPRGLYQGSPEKTISCHLKQEVSAADKTLRFVES